MNQVKHKNTISFIEVFESDEYFNIILEYLDGGTLDDWFNEK
jgi:serine/threonine protein kinase